MRRWSQRDHKRDEKSWKIPREVKNESIWSPQSWEIDLFVYVGSTKSADNISVVGRRSDAKYHHCLLHWMRMSSKFSMNFQLIDNNNNSFLLKSDEMSLRDAAAWHWNLVTFYQVSASVRGCVVADIHSVSILGMPPLTQYSSMNEFMESDFVINFLDSPYSTEISFRWMWCWEFWHIENYISHVREVKLVWHMALSTIVWMGTAREWIYHQNIILFHGNTRHVHCAFMEFPVHSWMAHAIRWNLYWMSSNGTRRTIINHFGFIGICLRWKEDAYDKWFACPRLHTAHRTHSHWFGDEPEWTDTNIIDWRCVYVD